MPLPIIPLCLCLCPSVTLYVLELTRIELHVSIFKKKLDHQNDCNFYEELHNLVEIAQFPNSDVLQS